MSDFIFQVFQSQPLGVAEKTNTQFETIPIEVTADNARDVLKYDHTPIQFSNGISRKENYIQALAVPADWDNSHSDDPTDWDTFESLSETFKGYSTLFYSSQNDNLPKIKGGVTLSPRPKIHALFPLSQPIPKENSDKFVAICNWFSRNHRADPKVKSPAQKMFGFGNHPNPRIHFLKGKCIDQILTESDLLVTPPVPKIQKQNIVPKTIAPLSTKTPFITLPLVKSNNAFDWFVQSGEWKNHLDDLKNWGFYEKNGVVYFQTPGGDRGAGKQDGNIWNGVAFFHSKAPAPFENGLGYSIPKFFAGALFGDIGKAGLSKFAKRYLN